MLSNINSKIQHYAKEVLNAPIAKKITSSPFFLKVKEVFAQMKQKVSDFFSWGKRKVTNTTEYVKGHEIKLVKKVSDEQLNVKTPLKSESEPEKADERSMNEIKAQKTEKRENSSSSQPQKEALPKVEELNPESQNSEQSNPIIQEKEDELRHLKELAKDLDPEANKVKDDSLNPSIWENGDDTNKTPTQKELPDDPLDTKEKEIQLTWIEEIEKKYNRKRAFIGKSNEDIFNCFLEIYKARNPSLARYGYGLKSNSMRSFFTSSLRNKLSNQTDLSARYKEMAKYLIKSDLESDERLKNSSKKLSNNSPLLKRYQEYIQNNSKDLSENDMDTLFEDYLCSLELEGTKGSYPEISAFAEFYKVTIWLFSEINGIQEIPATNPTGNWEAIYEDAEGNFDYLRKIEEPF